LNVERLHAIALELKADLEETQVLSVLEQLAAALQASVQQPAEPSHAQQVGTYRQSLNERLDASRTNDFSDSWRLSLEELGIWDLFGDRLRDQIEEIFRRNEITTSIAAAEIAAINLRLKEAAEAIEKLLVGLEGFNIGSEELALGDFEIGFLIPRGAVDNELKQLGEEFEELGEILGPFSELATGTRPDLEVRSIASSGFQIFLLAAPGLALTMAKVIESLLSSYERIRNIRAKATSLEEEDAVPEEVIAGLRKHANERIEIDIDALTNELVGQAVARLPEGRPFELQIAVKRSLRKLAKRIDEGYSIEVRAFVPPDDEDAEAPDVAEDVINVAKEITERQPRMRSMNLTGRPILELTEGDDGVDEEGDTPSPRQTRNPKGRRSGLAESE
jgi:hypothetical protein